jgi:predicted PurR-regulated permease PerM
MLAEKTFKRNIALGLVIGMAGLLAFALKDFLGAILGAVILFTLFKPLQRKLISLSVPSWLAALVVLLISMITVVGPITFVFIVLAQSIARFIQDNSQFITNLSKLKLDNALLDTSIYGNFTIKQALDQASINFVEIANRVTGFITNAFSNITGLILGLLIQSIVLYLVFFFLLKDMESYKKAFYEYSPFSAKNTTKLSVEFEKITRASIMGSGVVALAQGIAIFIAFLFVPQLKDVALLIGVMAALTSLIPVIGPILIWLPTTIVLILLGNPAGALFIALWGFIVVGNTDSFIRPIINNRIGQIHPLVSIIGLLIGIPMFGVLGIVLGPALLEFTLLFINMFREEFVVKE